MTFYLQSEADGTFSPVVDGTFHPGVYYTERPQDQVIAALNKEAK